MSEPEHGAEQLIVDGLVTVAEACKHLAVSRSFLYSEMDAGALPFCRLGRSRRIPRRALIQYAAVRLSVNATGPMP